MPDFRYDPARQLETKLASESSRRLSDSSVQVDHHPRFEDTAVTGSQYFVTDGERPRQNLGDSHGGDCETNTSLRMPFEERLEPRSEFRMRLQ
jgi:hypothetical protein